MKLFPSKEKKELAAIATSKWCIIMRAIRDTKTTNSKKRENLIREPKISRKFPRLTSHKMRGDTQKS
jgi:hypothetical protein